MGSNGSPDNAQNCEPQKERDKNDQQFTVHFWLLSPFQPNSII
jgi:hypothetical protein